MPFGPTNAPAIFQRLMNHLFSGEQWKFVFVYLDDLLTVSQSAAEHQAQLIVPNDQKIQAVKEFPQPICSKEIRSFLGLLN